MPLPILHIGYPKTGTTWFYDSYYPNVKNIVLLQPELFVDQISNSTFVVPNTNPDLRLILHHPELTGIRNFVWDKGIQREITAKNLKKHFPNATVIVFIRNQPDFLTSAYVYYVQQGGTFRPATLLDKFIHEELKFSLDFLKYNETIEVYRSLFGAKNVHVYLFEDFSKDRLKFINDYTKSYDLDIDVNKIDFSPVNDKLRIRLMNCLRVLNYFTQADLPFKKYYMNTMWFYNHFNLKYQKFNNWKIFGERAGIADLYRPDQIEYLNNYYKESNRKLVEKYSLTDILKYKYPM